MTTQSQYKPTDADFDQLDAAPVKSNQRSPEWYAARLGRFTGSEIYKLMTDPRSKADKDVGILSDTATGYIYQVLAGITTGITPEAFATSMQWGIDHEQEACEVYKTYFAEEITPCDFVPYGDFGGGSPDGFIGDEGIVEIKCPYNSGGHIENLKLAYMKATPEQFKEYHKEYYWQIQNNLMATGRKFCRFISYDPRFPGTRRIACVTVPRVEADIDAIRSKVQAASKILLDLKISLGL